MMNALSLNLLHRYCSSLVSRWLNSILMYAVEVETPLANYTIH